MLLMGKPHSAIAQCSLKYGWSASSKWWTYLLCTQLPNWSMLVDSCLGQPRTKHPPTSPEPAPNCWNWAKSWTRPGILRGAHMCHGQVTWLVWIYRAICTQGGEHNSNNYGFCGWYIELVDAVHGLRKPIYNWGAPPSGSRDNHPPVSLCQMGHSSKR
jgi:hypothetical protein